MMGDDSKEDGPQSQVSVPERSGKYSDLDVTTSPSRSEHLYDFLRSHTLNVFNEPSIKNQIGKIV